MIEILIKSSYLFNNAYLKIYKSLKLKWIGFNFDRFENRYRVEMHVNVPPPFRKRP